MFVDQWLYPHYPNERFLFRSNNLIRISSFTFPSRQVTSYSTVRVDLSPTNRHRFNSHLCSTQKWQGFILNIYASAGTCLPLAGRSTNFRERLDRCYRAVPGMPKRWSSQTGFQLIHSAHTWFHYHRWTPHDCSSSQPLEWSAIQYFRGFPRFPPLFPLQWLSREPRQIDERFFNHVLAYCTLDTRLKSVQKYCLHRLFPENITVLEGLSQNFAGVVEFVPSCALLEVFGVVQYLLGRV